jgi:conjugative relaxase-like TrwC/TraI family protein
VLSVHNLTVGQGGYYIKCADARVDAVESIGDSVEEYYVGGPEAPGRWLGAGAQQVRLHESVDGDALRRVLAGDDAAGEPLRASRVPVKVAGFDLTFSAPKT